MGPKRKNRSSRRPKSHRRRCQAALARIRVAALARINPRALLDPRLHPRLGSPVSLRRSVSQHLDRADLEVRVLPPAVLVRLQAEVALVPAHRRVASVKLQVEVASIPIRRQAGLGNRHSDNLDLANLHRQRLPSGSHLNRHRRLASLQSQPQHSVSRHSQSQHLVSHRSPLSAFGQASQPTSAFGQPSQPSGFGQPAFGSSGGFGSNAPKNPFAPASAAGGFGQSTSAFGQSSQSSSGFGQTSQPQPDFGFGTANQPGAVYRPPPPPPTPFGTANQPGTVYRKFDEPTQTLEQALQAAKGGFGSNTSAFGQPTTASSGFGSVTAPAFGQTGFSSGTGSAFGQTGAPTNPFGVASAADQPKDANMDTTSRPQSRANPFGNPDTSSPTQSNTSPTQHPLLDRPPHALHYTESLPQGPTQKNPAGRLTVYRGQPVTYENNNPYYRRPDTRQLERIWFPDGAAEVEYIGRDDNVWDTQGQPDEYTDDVVEQYKYLFEQGMWRDGKMPLVPPLRAWAVYDF